MRNARRYIACLVIALSAVMLSADADITSAGQLVVWLVWEAVWVTAEVCALMEIGRESNRNGQ